MLKLISAFDMDFNCVKDYYDAFENKWLDLNCYAILLANDGKEKYFDYIKNNHKNLYYLINDELPDYILGCGTIDDELDYHEDYLNVGNISYDVRPNERCKGYGTNLLKLLLFKCEDLGMTEVYVVCEKNNIASRQVILNNNGILEKEFLDDYIGQGVKYWIELKPKLLSKIHYFFN